MRFDFHLDTDPDGTGKRSRWWALVLGWSAVILAEVVVLWLMVAAVIGKGAP